MSAIYFLVALGLEHLTDLYALLVVYLLLILDIHIFCEEF